MNSAVDTRTMPEGPEVRKYADAIDQVLSGRPVRLLTARTREAKAWLSEHGQELIGRKVVRVFSHGKHLIGSLEDDYYFHSHLMMWGRWETFQPKAPVEIDRRERARIVVDGGAALLLSAPIFDVGLGDPYEQIENLASLGPDVLPYKGKFDKAEFLRRLLLPEYLELTIGAALLNQQISAGVGNYLRAEVLFSCRLNPWRKISELNKKALACLSKTIPELSRRSYLLGGLTASDEQRERMRSDASLVYQPGREYGTRHTVFRRTNLPCLVCGTPIKQQRQATHLQTDEDEERTRIVYYCPVCQKVD